MIEVVSIKFKNRGKIYYFDPRGLDVKTGDKLVVETAKGLELADCSWGNHHVEETAVVQPLRPVLRVATADDLRIDALNRQREQEAYGICRQKIAQHGLEMKLVSVEYNFEGNKITFYFTADGRVDFRELVKDLASVFRSRIELRQIGVRDEAKMVGGIGICGRPFCCSAFMDDFQPVSTKMAKVQSLSLNPTKISGSCGRLMCCLRYEQEAYEDLVKKVPRQGSFVETIDGYGTAVQVNLLRQNVKVKLDKDTDDTLHLYKACELCQVPGGRPCDGKEPPHVLDYHPPEEPELPEEPENEWAIPAYIAEEPETEPVPAVKAEVVKKTGRRRRGGRDKGAREADKAAESTPKAAGGKKPQREEHAAEQTEAPASPEKEKSRRGRRGARRVKAELKHADGAEKSVSRPESGRKPEGEKHADGEKKARPSRRRPRRRGGESKAPHASEE